MISKATRLLRVETHGELAAALLMMLSYPCIMVAALLPNGWLFSLAAAVSYAGDWYLHRRGAYLINRLSKARAGLSIRFLARELMVILFLARTELGDNSIYFVAIVCFLLFYALQAPHSALLTIIRNRRRLPFATRNIGLGGLRITDAPPTGLTSRAAEKMLHLDLAVVLGLLAAVATDEPVYGFVGSALTLGLGVLYVALLCPYLRGSRLPAGTEQALEFMDEWLAAYRPTTVLYFSGSRDSAYQANMWLGTMEELGRRGERPLVVLRERFILPQLGETAVPVLCVPSAVHLMNMDLSTVRVALYPANVGKNIHLLRVPSMKHVFVGHGDSDKLASVNPFSKAYDEVWTAGRAGRDRYALAEVGVRDEDIVEVGRPQLERIEPWDGSPVDGVPTILYAPTWEGWTDEPGNTSLILAGENLVRRLTASEPPVRVLYKPHPFTGTRSAKAQRAHERIVALLEKSSAERAADPAWAARIAEDAGEQAQGRVESARVEAALAALDDKAGTYGDEAVASRDSVTDPQGAAAVAELGEEWNTAYWRSLGTWEHRVVTGSRPHLYDCFNEADAMVSDISSVVSDFIATGKPYAITDSAELGVEEFMLQNTAARASLVLTNDASQIDELVKAALSEGTDSLASARQELKEYLLGSDEPTSMERFAVAVRTLAAEADDRLARQPQDSPVGAAEVELEEMTPERVAGEELSADASGANHG